MSSQRQMRFSELIRSLISECILVEDFYNLDISIFVKFVANNLYFLRYPGIH